MSSSQPANQTVVPSPSGVYSGRITVPWGGVFGRFLGWLASRLLWRGKVFGSEGRSLVNLVTPLKLKVLPGRVVTEMSWMDGQPILVLDYRGTSRLLSPFRDELRETAPGEYQGWAYLRSRGPRSRPLLYFSLSRT